MQRNRLKLIIIFAVFLGPLAAAFVWYYGLGAALAPHSRTNHAHLLTPSVVVAEFTNPGANLGAQVNRQALKQKWHVIHVLTETCDTACRQALYHTRQARLALGKDANRVRRIFISPSHAMLTRLATDHPDSLRLLAAANGLEKQLNVIIQTGRRDANDAFLIDPLGNIMMRIPAELAPRLLLKDLKHLLRVSRVG